MSVWLLPALPPLGIFPTQIPPSPQPSLTKWPRKPPRGTWENGRRSNTGDTVPAYTSDPMCKRICAMCSWRTQSGAEPCFSQQPSPCLNEKRPWLWMQNWVLKHELSSMLYIQRGEFQQEMWGQYLQTSCLVHTTLLFLWDIIALSSPWFWPKKDKWSCQDRENVKRAVKLIQWKIKNSYFSLTYYLYHSIPCPILPPLKFFVPCPQSFAMVITHQISLSSLLIWIATSIGRSPRN